MFSKPPIQIKNPPYFQCLHWSRNTDLVTQALQQKPYNKNIIKACLELRVCCLELKAKKLTFIHIFDYFSLF